MDKIIRSTADALIQPLIEEIKDRYEQTLLDLEARQGGIPKAKSIIGKEAEDLSEEIREFLIDEDSISRLEKGFEIVLDHVKKDPGKEGVLKDLSHAGERLVDGRKSNEEADIPVHDTLMETFGLDECTFETIYGIGTKLLNEEKIDEALNLFTLLTTLNNLVFEPWLALGCCWQLKKRYPDALHAFTMASLANFQHPAPHLYAAECYLFLDSNKLARETLELALSNMDASQKEEYKSHISYLNQEIKEERR